MKKLTFLILSLLMSSFISRAGSGSCTLYSSANGSAQCTSTDSYYASDTWYVSNSGSSISLHGWGAVPAYPEYGYVLLEAAWDNYYTPSYADGQHWYIAYDNETADAQSYGSQVDLYGGNSNMNSEGTLWLSSRTTDGAYGGIYASW